MGNRSILTKGTVQFMRRTSYELEDILRNGGVGYETKSAIWAYSPRRDVVSLFVKNPQPGMSNDWIEYDRTSKNYDKHYKRIMRIAGV